jgi:hypothetical protein
MGYHPLVQGLIFGQKKGPITTLNFRAVHQALLFLTYPLKNEGTKV